MKILVGVEPVLHLTPPWYQRNYPILQCRRNLNNHPTFQPRSWRLRAEAKGFNSAPTKSSNMLQQKDRENAETRKLRRNNGKEEEEEEDDDDDDDDKIPEAVSKRIIFRILFYVGVPLITGLALLQVMSIIKEEKWWNVPIWLPFLTTFLTFGASALGIAYGTLSTSWDAQREGSFLGFEEAQKNWVEIWKEEEGGGGKVD